MRCAEMVLWHNTKPLCDRCKSIDNTMIAHFNIHNEGHSEPALTTAPSTYSVVDEQGEVFCNALQVLGFSLDPKI
jgi:hypothetical protein